jgi:hypothetical protein
MIRLTGGVWLENIFTNNDLKNRHVSVKTGGFLEVNILALKAVGDCSKNSFSSPFFFDP